MLPLTLSQCGCSVFTTATALLIYLLVGFLHSVLLQSSLGIRPIKGTDKPPVRSGYQDAFHVTSVEPLNDRLERCVRAGGRWAQFHHLFHLHLSVSIKAVSPDSSEDNPPFCGYDARLFASCANPVYNYADPVGGPAGNVVAACDITSARYTR